MKEPILINPTIFLHNRRELHGFSQRIKIIEIKPIGFVYTASEKIPRHWTVSDVEGVLNVDMEYAAGLRDIKSGQRIVVIFLFHKSPDFISDFLFQAPPNRKKKLGVFSNCSPIRPNPTGMSVLEVLKVNGSKIYVKGIDMLDGTPVLDIKPFIESKFDCPSYQEK